MYSPRRVRHHLIRNRAPASCTQIALLTQVHDFIDSGMHLPHPHKEAIIADSEPAMGWESGYWEPKQWEKQSQGDSWGEARAWFSCMPASVSMQVPMFLSGSLVGSLVDLWRTSHSRVCLGGPEVLCPLHTPMLVFVYSVNAMLLGVACFCSIQPERPYRVDLMRCSTSGEVSYLFKPLFLL